jgi:hypothetical protein
MPTDNNGFLLPGGQDGLTDSAMSVFDEDKFLSEKDLII